MTVVHYGEGDSKDTLTLDGNVYEFDHLHFHTPSEHTVDGKYYPGEAHFVHINKEIGQIAVISMFMEVGEHRNEQIESILAMAPDKKGEHVEMSTTQDMQMPGMLKLAIQGHSEEGVGVGHANEKSHFRYKGSLTTATGKMKAGGCTENVEWVVFEVPMSISQGQLDEFERRFPHSNRPIQSSKYITVTEYGNWLGLAP